MSFTKIILFSVTFLIFIIQPVLSFSQNTPEIDSLLTCLQNESIDTNKVNIMQEICIAYRAIKSPKANDFARQALNLALDIHFQKGIAECYQTMAIQMFANGEYPDAIIYLKKAIAEFTKLNNEIAVANCYKRIGLTQAYQDKYDSGIMNYEIALDIFIRNDHKKFMAECYNDIGVLYNYQGDHQKSMEFQFKSLDLCRQMGDKKAISARLVNIGTAYSDQSNFNQAIKYLSEALDMKTELDDKRGISMCYNNLGEVYNLKGDFGKAIEYYEKSLNIDTELDDQEGMAIGLLNIGNVHSKQQNIEKANQYYNQSLAIAKLIGNKRLAANVLNLIGELLIKQSKYSEAHGHFQQAIDFSTEIGDKSEIAKSLFFQGETFMAEKKYADAISAYQLAHNLHNELGETGEMAKDDIKLGKAWFEKGNTDKAILLYKKGFEIADSIGSKETIHSVTELLAQAYFIKKDYLKAYQYQKLFKQVHDSIFTLESKKQIAEVETRFELEKSQQQIELQLTRLARQDAELKQQRMMQYGLLGIIFMALIAVALFINGYLRIKKAKTTIDRQMVQIKEKNEELNQINEELQVTLETNTRQKEQIEIKNKEITDSIQYARYIQRAVLPNVDKIRKTIPEHFVVIKPKQIISGDFYWVTELNNLHILAVADCTGHGVPGAFMSMLGISLLNEIINKENIIRPDHILQRMRNDVVMALNQRGNIGELRDGIAMGICQIDFQNQKLKFAGANTPIYIIRDSGKTPIAGTIAYSIQNNTLYEFKGDKMPIALSKKMDPYSLHEIDLQKEDMIYLFSDGFADQFGGPENKRFQYRNFKELLLNHCQKPMNLQKVLLEDAFTEWQDGNDQMDDVLVLGFKVI